MRSVVAGRTLLDAAGSLPVAQRETVGTQWLSLAQMPALDDRTIYVVVEPSEVPSGVSRVFGSGADAEGQSLWLRSTTGGKWEVRPQFAAGGGAGAAYGEGLPVGVRVGRSVLMWRSEAGLTAFRLTGRGQQVTRAGLDAGAGLTAPCLGIVASEYDLVLWAGIWRGAHSWQQAARVHQWLAQRYLADGSPPPLF